MAVGLIAGLGLGGVAHAQTTTPAADSAGQSAVVTHASRADVAGAIVDSLKLLMMEHASRIMFQPKTRRELGGNFFADYRQSVTFPTHWGDTDGWFVNYVGHPIHGAAAGYVWMEHDPHSREEFGLNSGYWNTKWRAVAWSAVYSLQFESGPISEASIGNVGMNPATTGWVDYVVTPIGALGIMVTEDALDRYLVKWVETRTTNRFARTSLRLVMNPSRALSNMAVGKVPWHRDGRPLNWR